MTDHYVKWVVSLLEKRQPLIVGDNEGLSHCKNTNSNANIVTLLITNLV